MGVKKKVSPGVLEKFRVQLGTTLFTKVVVFFHSIFTSDAHALAVLPDIAHFTLDEEFACTFVIVTYESKR